MGLKENIKRIRTSQGKTLDDVAKYVGVTRQTVQKYESGLICNIPAPAVEKMAEFFSVSPAYLMGWEDAPTKERSPAPIVQNYALTPDEQDLLTDYRKLNNIGKDKAKEYVSDLTGNEKYTSAQDLKSKLG